MLANLWWRWGYALGAGLLAASLLAGLALRLLLV